MMTAGLTNGINWEYIGAQLANSGDDVQVAFLRAFLRECQSWGTAYQVQMQFAAINHKLTEDEREALSMITYIERVKQ